MRVALLALFPGLMSLMPATAQVMDFQSLPAWDKDAHLAALQSFQRTCDLLDHPLFTGYSKSVLQDSSARFAWPIDRALAMRLVG